MNTQLLKESEIKKAAGIIKSGGVVAFRTETVYGLAADATNPDAVKKVFTAKGRPAVNPLIVHFYSLSELFSRFPNIDCQTRRVLEKIKSAITVILPRPDFIPLVTTGGLETVAVRVPSCRFARLFIKSCGVPLAAPSANTSTRPSPTRWQDVAEDLDGHIDAILCGKQTQIGVESTVVKVTGGKIQVLRLGGISTSELTKKTGLAAEHKPTHESPGTRFKHYAPKCPLYLTKDPDRVKDAGAKVIRCRDLGQNPAKNLFAAIRDAEKNSKFIICEVFPDLPKYQTINERLGKASSGWYNKE